MNACIDYIRQIRDIMPKGKQRDFYQAKMDAARAVEITPMAEVFTAEEISTIRRAVDFKHKECYRHATLIANLFPDIMYVEGMTTVCELPIEHAFNRRGDKYFDATIEVLFKDKSQKRDYCSILELPSKEVMERVTRQGFYGDLFPQIYLEKNKIAQK